MSRRTRTPARLLARLLSALCLVVLAGCAGQADLPRQVTILGPWTGDEETAFRRILDRFTAKEGIEVEYQGTTAQREVLLAEVQAGTPPDVAVLPGPGELADYVRNGALVKLDPSIDVSAYKDPWLTHPDGRPGTYWIPIKADLKSIVWHRKGVDPTRLRPDVGTWCVGMGSDATSGWPGSDWIEDILLQRWGPQVYERWATGKLPWTDQRVKDTWRIWGAFMRGGEEQALITDHRGDHGSHGLLFDTSRRCSLEHTGSFARALYGDHARDADFALSSALLPGARRLGRNLEVSGDFAGMFKKTDEARKLMAYLADPATQRTWADITDPAVFSASDTVGRGPYRNAVDERIAKELSGAGTLCLDASDAMPPELRNAFHEKVLQFLSRPGDLGRILGDLERLQDDIHHRHVGRLSSVCGSRE